MIRRLTGTIVDANLLSVVLDVGGVGYHIFTTAGTLALGENTTFHTYLAVRENAMDLYGFATPEELAMFELLIELPKIGPKSAMQILSQADIALLRKATVAGDPAYLSKMSGIGKKTAEKIVTGLKEQFGDDNDLSHDSSRDGDVIDALITLGYSQKEARDAVLRLPPELADTNTRIKEVLKDLGRKS